MAIEHDKQRSMLDEVNMFQIMEEIKTNLQPALEGFQGRLEVGSMMTITACPAEMKFLLFHLVTHALKYHMFKVPLIIKVWMESSFLNQTCDIFVQDNSQYTNEHLIERIFWTAELDKETYQETFTLSLCRKIVENYSGSISLKSQGKEGELFTVTLPCIVMPSYL